MVKIVTIFVLLILVAAATDLMRQRGWLPEMRHRRAGRSLVHRASRGSWIGSRVAFHSMGRQGREAVQTIGTPSARASAPGLRAVRTAALARRRVD
jgi:hypothetical protein